jgi:hypothetical protein
MVHSCAFQPFRAIATDADCNHIVGQRRTARKKTATTQRIQTLLPIKTYVDGPAKRCPALRIRNTTER